MPTHKFYPTIVLRLAFLLLLFAGCEKNETIVQTDNNTFCPLKFKCYPETGILDGCGFVFVPYYYPVLSTADDGVVVKTILAKHNTPFIAANPSPTSVLSRYHAYHRTSPNCSLKLVFEKISMEEGTRVSLYDGKTRPSTFGDPEPYMGDLNTSPVGPSLVHDWQIYVQRETDGSYTLGYIANGIAQVAQSNIIDFTTAEFLIFNQSGKSFLLGSLTGNGSTALFSTEGMDIPPIPDDYFGAFGFNVIESLQDDCTDRPIEIKLKNYAYTSNTSAGNYQDDFKCNTIWFQQ